MRVYSDMCVACLNDGFLRAGQTVIVSYYSGRDLLLSCCDIYSFEYL